MRKARGARHLILGMTANVAGFGTTVTAVGAPVQYMDAGTGDPAIVCMDARELTGLCVIARRTATATDPGFKMVPDDSGAELWEHTSSPYDATARPTGGCASHATGVYVGYSDSTPDGIVAELSIATGAEQWTTNHGGGQVLSTRGTDYEPVSDFVFSSTNNFGNEIVEFDAANSGAVGDDVGHGAVGTRGKGTLEGGTHFVHVGGTEVVLLFALPWGGEAATRTIDFKSGGDTPSLDWSATAFGVGAAANEVAPSCKRDRVGAGAWICAGRAAGGPANEPWLFHFIDDDDPVDIELDVSSLSGLAFSGTAYVMDHCVDTNGDVLALVTNGLLSSDDADIVRVTSTGAFVYSCATDNVAGLPDGEARSICVDEDGTFFVGDESGQVYVYAQT